MTALSDYLGSLSNTAKALTALAGAGGVGFAFAVGLVGFTSMPDRMNQIETLVEAHDSAFGTLPGKVDELGRAVSANTTAIGDIADTIAVNTGRIHALARGDSTIICLLTIDSSGMSPLQIRRACP